MKLNFIKIEKLDSEILADWLSSETWPFFIGNTPTKESVITRIEGGEFFGEGDLNFWIINSDDEKIGLVEIYQLDDLAPMFSIRFKEKFRGKGHGKVALNWLTSFIFENFPDKRRIEAQTREDNIGMRKVFNKQGYVMFISRHR